MTNKPYGTLYIALPNDLSRRAYEHREGMIRGFTKNHGLKRLVWFAEFPSATEAISCEKKIKKWRREWKKHLVEKFNPAWRDLYEAN
jgi:putative endonuclease